jgi:hypothetical protein
MKNRKAVVVRAKDVLDLAKEVINEGTFKIWVSASKGKFKLIACNERDLFEKASSYKEALMLNCNVIAFILSPDMRDTLIRLSEEIIQECGADNGLIMFTREYINEAEKDLIASIDKRKIDFVIEGVEHSILD